MSSARSLLCLLAFVFAVVGTMSCGIRALDRADVRSPTVGLNLVPLLFKPLGQIRTDGAGPGPPRVAFLGDSISISVRGGARTVPQALRRELGDDFELHSLAALGLGPFDYYFLADEIAAARPDQVVIAFSLQSFGSFFRSLSRERLSGWVSPTRLPEVGLSPTHWIGLHADDLLMNVAIVQASGAEVWRKLLIEQARFGAARSDFSKWLGNVYGRKGPEALAMARFAHERRRTRVEDPDRDRYNAEAERRHFGAAFTGVDERHPILRALAGMLEVLGQAGIPTLVYVNPINIEHLTAIGAAEGAHFESTLAALERVVRRGGGDFLDLHELLPDSAFRDAAGHLGPPASSEGPLQIATAVASHLRAHQH